MCAGEAPTGLLGGSLFEREIIEFHSTFSRHGNAQASLTLLIWLNEKVQKLSLKIIQKILGGAPVGAPFFGVPFGQKSYRIDSKSNRIFLGSDPSLGQRPHPCSPLQGAGSLITSFLHGRGVNGEWRGGELPDGPWRVGSCLTEHGGAGRLYKKRGMRQCFFKIKWYICSIKSYL